MTTATEPRKIELSWRQKRLGKKGLIEEITRLNGMQDLPRQALLDELEWLINMADAENLGLKQLHVQNGEVVLDAEVNTVVLHSICQSLREIFLSEGGTNYIETTFHHGDDPPDDWWVITLQRKHRYTPHGIRQDLESRIDTARDYIVNHLPVGKVLTQRAKKNVLDLLERKDYSK